MRLSLALVASVLAGGHAHELRGPRATAPGDNGAHVGAGSATGVAAEAMASARAEGSVHPIQMWCATQTTSTWPPPILRRSRNPETRSGV